MAESREPTRATQSSLPETKTPPQRREQISSLNGLRAVSVFMVVASHLATAVSTPPAIGTVLLMFNGHFFDGALGVRIFFCISGFLNTYLLLRERDRAGHISLKTFYIRRTLRIFPVLYAFVLFLFVATQTTALVVTPCQFVTALTFTKNYGCSSWIEGHLWSLAVELQFYLFWPAVLVFVSTRAATRFAIAAIFLAPFSRLFEASAGLPQWWLTSNIDMLMVGSLAALGYRYRRDVFDRILETQPALMRLVGFLGLIAPVILGRLFTDEPLRIMFAPTVQAFAATFLIVSYAFGPTGLSKAALNSKPLNFLGLISYSLYVWQEAFFIWPADFGFDRLLTFEWPFNIAGMLIVAMASYYCLERPLLSLRAKYVRGHKP